MINPFNDPASSALNNESVPRFGLDSLFYPNGIVLIDATNQDPLVADSLWKNITASYPAEKVNRITVSAESLDFSDVPERTDLAVIIAPRSLHDSLIRACDARHIRSGVLLTPDYRKSADPASEVPLPSSEELPNRLRYLGPQSHGFIIPHHNLNTTSLPLSIPKAGNIAFLSQSGSMCSAVVDWSKRTSTGFSAVVSCGSMTDIDWYDLITYFGDDPRTKSIIIYLENIPDSRSFFSAAREISLSKPIIVLKAGRTLGGSAVAATHNHGDNYSGSLLDAAFQRVGVLRVKSIAELFYMANILSTQPLPKGPRLAVITNAIGPAIMATDALLDSGGQLAEFSDELISTLQQDLPEGTTITNPLDLMGDAMPERYGSAARSIVQEKNIDGLLVIFAPQFVNHPKDTARQIVAATRKFGKPVVASWMGKDRVSEGRGILYDGGIPAFLYPDTPARLFALMWRQAQNLDAIYETPVIIADEDESPADAISVNIMLEGIREQDRTELNEWEAMAVLAAYGIRAVQTLPAFSEDEAVTCASITGYPVALKLLSSSYQLKSAVHGVRLNLRNEQDVRDGFKSIQDSVIEFGKPEKFLGVTVQKMVSRKGIDLVVGTRVDEQFGPYIYFGSGGYQSNMIIDHAVGLPPLTTALAQRMIEKTRAWQSLQSNSKVNRETVHQLQSILVRVAQLVTQNRVIQEMEINPLLCNSDSVTALDARIILHPTSIKTEDLPRSAIRPYPVQYTWHETLRDKTRVTIRPVRPEDEPMVVEFHRKLSEETIYRRYFFQHKLTRRTSHERLRRTCFLDFDREIALAAESRDTAEGRIIMGIGRFTRTRQEDVAEIAIVIADPYQGKGLGSTILKHLVDIARAENIRKLEGTMLPGNMHMQHLFTRIGFKIKATEDTVAAELFL